MNFNVKIVKLGLFSIIPMAFLLFYLWLGLNQTPYFHSYNSDPQYIHIFSALNLSQGIFEIGNLDNPGTPLQVFEAVV